MNENLIWNDTVLIRMGGTVRHADRNEQSGATGGEFPYRRGYQRAPAMYVAVATTNSAPMTRVEFTLEPHNEGTRLFVVESGFASLPPALRTRESHVEGWQRELGELAQYLAAP